MTKIELLAFLLALSLAFLIALVAGILATTTGKSVAAAALVVGGVAMTAVAADRCSPPTYPSDALQ
jgi:hypothetical protein